MPQAFVFDVNKCTGCGACQLACTIENGLEPDRSWRSVSTFNERLHPGIPLFHLSLACNHCAEPACMEACPALAYEKDPRTGAVLINEDACIGCNYCAWACPFDAPRLDEARGVMTKCTFCNHRLAEGKTPACAELCPTGALTVVDIPEEEMTQPVAGFPQTALRPAIRIVPPRNDFVPMAGTETPVRPLAGATPDPKITLRKEWPLAVFTVLVALLFAMVTATVAAGGELLPGRGAGLSFAALAAAGMLLGSAHLGRKARAWRIVLNVARSPLSREIVAFSIFAALGFAYLAQGLRAPTLGILAAVAGLIALAAVEDVYRYAERRGSQVPHSANVLLTGPFLAATLLTDPLSRSVGGAAPGRGIVAVLAALALTKLGLYLWRALPSSNDGIERSRVVASARLVPPVLGALASAASGMPGILVAGVLAGELVDRCQLYTELAIMTPRLQIARDLSRRLRLHTQDQ